MAHKVNNVLANVPSTDKVVVVSGVMSICYGMGVPERVMSKNPELADDIFILCSNQSKKHLDPNDKASLQREYEQFYGSPEAAKPGHMAYIC
jgi:hypothetical protein